MCASVPERVSVCVVSAQTARSILSKRPGIAYLASHQLYGSNWPFGFTPRPPRLMTADT